MILREMKEILDNNPSCDAISHLLSEELLSGLRPIEILDLFHYASECDELNKNHLELIYTNLNDHFIRAKEIANQYKDSDEDFFENQIRWIHHHYSLTLGFLANHDNSDNFLLHKLLYSEPGRFEYVKEHPNFNLDIKQIVESKIFLLGQKSIN